MNTKEWVNKIDGTMTELLHLLSAIADEQINLVPFEGSWTAGQLAEHLIMSNSGFVDMINGPVKETERAPDTLTERIKADFLDFNTKLKSPDFVVPPEAEYEKDVLLRSLRDIKADILQAMNSLDMTKTCLSFELPVYGFLTRLEAVSFIHYHTQRHIHQLKNIYKTLSEKQFANSKIASI